MKNLAAKTVGKYGMSREELAKVAYQVWQTADGSWTWYVLKMNQADDDKPYASWFAYVFSPYAAEMGDTYVADIKGWPGVRKVANRMPELVAAAQSKA